MKKFYVTFGFAHVQRKKFFVIEANTYAEARRLAFDRFGAKFCTIYSQEDWVKDDITQDEKYGYSELIIKPDTCQFCGANLILIRESKQIENIPIKDGEIMYDDIETDFDEIISDVLHCEKCGSEFTFDIETVNGADHIMNLRRIK